MGRWHRRHAAWVTALILWVAPWTVSAAHGEEPQKPEAWHAGDLASAMTLAAAEDKRVLLYVSADWCSTCRLLHREVFASADGQALLSEFVSLTVDFDLPANRPLVERLVILGLPTTVVLETSGKEAGRVAGYETAGDWLGRVGRLERDRDTIAGAMARWEDTRDSPAAALAVGKLMLNHGRVDEGTAWLERTMWLSAGGIEEAEALFLLGRYAHRVRRDPATAHHLWRELVTRFPDSPWAPSGWAWYARAQAEMGRAHVGAAALHARVRGDRTHYRACVTYARFVAKHGVEPHRPAAAAALEGVLEKAAPGQRDALHALRVKLVAP